MLRQGRPEPVDDGRKVGDLSGRVHGSFEVVAGVGCVVPEPDPGAVSHTVALAPEEILCAGPSQQ